MRAGEKVRFKDAVGGGVIKNIIDDERVLITDDYGFDMTVEVSRLVVVDVVGDEMMRTRKVRRKAEPDAGRDGRTRSKAMVAGGGRGAGEVSGSVVAGGSSCVEVDFHSAVLGIDSLPSELQRELQMEYFRRQMAAHAMHKGWKIVFIHGKGDGILREAIWQEIRKKYPHCTLQDASFSQYGFQGATEVIVV